MPKAMLIDGTEAMKVRFVCAHGAGGPMDSPFLGLFASLLAERGVCTLRFEFAYMAARREGGKRRPPPRAETLIGEYQALVEDLARTGGAPLVIGGKSMGGRVASMMAAQAHREKLIKGLVCLGYPFHPPNKPEQLRIAHLAQLACPSLVVQGERDPFGNRSEVEDLALSPEIALHWASDGDHDLGPRGGSGFTRKGNLAAAADAVARFALACAAA